jgi:hypothetical protein
MQRCGKVSLKSHGKCQNLSVIAQKTVWHGRLVDLALLCRQDSEHYCLAKIERYEQHERLARFSSFSVSCIRQVNWTPLLLPMKGLEAGNILRSQVRRTLNTEDCWCAACSAMCSVQCAICDVHFAMCRHTAYPASTVYIISSYYQPAKWLNNLERVLFYHWAKLEDSVVRHLITTLSITPRKIHNWSN